MHLIVAVQDGNFILKTKPNAHVLYTTEQRKAMVEALRVVDEVVVYQDVDTLLPLIDFDVFAIGEDQTHSGFQRALKWCEDNAKEVIKIPRTQGICSSDIKGQLKELC